MPTRRERDQVFFQEYVEGEPCAAIYVGDGKDAKLLGITRQLVGEPWLHARPFHYCCSIGPFLPAPPTREAFERLGQALCEGCRLVGIFGVDCLLRDGVPWPVEVNPRYTASVEVLEYSTGVAALAWHRRVFDPAAPEPPPVPEPAEGPVIGKAILFSRAPLTFPADGPWVATLRQPGVPADLPAFADIPHPGERIRARRPVLTFFARGHSTPDCLNTLQQIAQDLDRRLFSP
jgi:predicted ATP-grasp superfamily ATP-dependent carboligase